MNLIFFSHKSFHSNSDYLNDNALRKMDIFLSLLFSERMFFFTLLSVQFFQENLISGENVLCTLFSR